ncbi:MAG TPA: hypothetical protein DCG75_11345 [Bacteroidales bacterium]|nr:hypothetical protein [Bacteroidales bacterium]
MKKFFALFFSLFIVFAIANAQVDKDFDKLKSAYLHIQNENYQEAYNYFKEVLNIYPKEPIYNYYVGRCLFFLDKDPMVSLKYLRFAATKEVPEDVYYFLGRAYLNNYQFDKALENLEWFKKRASKKQIRELELDNYISMAQNGLYLSKYVKKPLVYSKKKSQLDHFYENYIFDEQVGTFVDKFDFFSLTKDSVKEQSILFVPGLKTEHEVFYFSDINEKRGDYDIYRITRLSDTSWSEPENLGDIINTPFDENYPYLHADGTTLYFASKGHYGMGGYDLYRSSWNWDKQEWTEPENLDFPINSPFDDILFVPSPNKKTAFFASNREAVKPNIMVYKLKLSSAEPYIETKNHEELVELSKLMVNISAESEKGRVVSEKNKPDQYELVKLKGKESILYKTKYDSLLDLAIQHQLKADSLKWIIDEKRMVFENTKEGQERAKISTIIIELEREIYRLQKDADNCYAQVRQIEQANLASQKSIYEDGKKTEKSDKNETTEVPVKTNVFVEPVQDSIQKSYLLMVNEGDDEPFSDYGLRIEVLAIYHLKNSIPVNKILPEGIVYMIQLGVFSSEKNPEVFKGLTPLFCIKNDNSTNRKYFAGMFQYLAEAEKNLPIVKSKGFKDAFVVAFNSNKPIAIKEAVQLESVKNNPTQKVVNKNSIDHSKKENDLSIIYVLKGQINANDSMIVINSKANLPENTDLYFQKKNEESFFIIKPFLSYDEASIARTKLKDLIKSEIEIHAYFAENQIPLEQARKITK